jgi:hypothetical protein
MNVTNKFTKLLGTATLVVALSMLDVSMKPKSALQTGNDLAQIVDRISVFNEAQASILSQDDGNGGSMANHIRFMYMLINGAGANGYPPNMDGPEGGFLGMIREITGPDALGGGLAASGFSTCASVPATGSATMTDAEGTFTMYFETPVKTVPTGYTGAGAKFDKRVVVQFNDTTFMNIEFNCDTTVGWLRMAFGDGADMVSGTLRHIEIYYDTQTAADSHLELYMTNLPGTATGDEYFVAKFDTLSSTIYKFWIIRGYDTNATDHGFRAAAHGDSSTNMVNAYMKFTTDITEVTTDFSTDGASDLIANGDIQCVDFSTPGSPGDGGSGCDALAMTDAGTPISDASGGFSVKWVADAANGLKNAMTALADPTNP